jgi:hypothetical protein
MNNTELFSESNAATYCPEDDKIRLYVGRVPRAEYEALRAEGWTSTPKQDCDFVAVWTPARESTAISYAGIIDDEDQSPADRAADRAERFAEYCDKRTSEAVGHAGNYSGGAHGFQNGGAAGASVRRAERAAGRALSSWDRAEYWHRRTDGVIRHALHACKPGVRAIRIKKLESDLRKSESWEADYALEFKRWGVVAATDDAEKAGKLALYLANRGGCGLYFHHPRPETCGESYIAKNSTSLHSLLTFELSPITGHEAAALWLAGKIDPESEAYAFTGHARSMNHLRLRIAYEKQMLEAQGGRAGSLEMEVAGHVGPYQIRKVNKSSATGAVVSVTVRCEGNRWGNKAEPGAWFLEVLNVERLSQSSYTPPTDDDRAKLKAQLASEKAKAPKVEACPLINPTDADAERLQALWNARVISRREARRAYKSDEAAPVVARMTQEQYSERSKGTYSRCETKQLRRTGTTVSAYWSDGERARETALGGPVCKVRVGAAGGCIYQDRVIVITDKPQKPLPASVWESAPEAVAALV